MLLKNVRKKIKSKKGASMVEFTMVMTTFIMVFCVGFDFVMIGYKYMSVSNYANDLVRTLAVQGGALSSAPKGFQGGGNNYKTLAQIKAEKNAFAATVGVKSTDMNVFIVYDDGVNARREININGTAGFQVNYLVPFEIVVEYVPKLELLQNFGPTLTNKVRISKVGISEYVQNSQY